MAAVPGGVGGTLGIGAGKIRNRCADAAGGLGAVVVSDVPFRVPLRCVLLCGINAHAAGGVVSPIGGFVLSPRHGRCCRGATDFAALAGLVSVVSPGPSDGRDL